MTDFNKAIDLPACYNVRGYLTWYFSHKLHSPSITTLNTHKSICQEDDISCPHKICFSY